MCLLAKDPQTGGVGVDVPSTPSETLSTGKGE